MDLLRLDPTTFVPNLFITDWNSLIWTERYVQNGDFTLKTYQMDDARKNYPEGTFLSLRDSTEVMVVESVAIGPDDNGNPIATVTGRSWETFLENRGYEWAYQDQKWPMMQKYRPNGAVDAFLWNTFCNDGPLDVSQGDGYEEWLINTEQKIDYVSITDSSPNTDDGIVTTIDASESNKYATLLRLLRRAECGIRCMRPRADTSSGVVITIAQDGTLTRTPTTGITGLRLDVFKGLDRTKGQLVNTPVIFHVSKGDLSEPNYLWSNSGYKNICYVRYPGVTDRGHETSLYVTVTAPGTSLDVAGINRREMTIDVDPPPDNQTTDQIQAFLDKCKNLGLQALDQQRKTTMFDAKLLDTQTSYKYGNHFALGDYVSLIGKYNMIEDLVVSEYVRSQDKTGETGYPTLVLPAEV